MISRFDFSPCKPYSKFKAFLGSPNQDFEASYAPGVRCRAGLNDLICIHLLLTHKGYSGSKVPYGIDVFTSWEGVLKIPGSQKGLVVMCTIRERVAWS
jgi:hypothetical protein